MKKYLWLILLTSLTLSCASELKQKSSPPEIKPLTQEEAQSRSQRVHNIFYNVKIDLTNSNEHYNGEVTLYFDLNSIDGDLRIDFKEGHISKAVINNVEDKDFLTTSEALFLPKNKFKKGPNSIQLTFQHNYSTSGIGLHRFVDPLDKNIYLYTHFEPNDASRFIPCFDQPDMKGVFDLTVLAPQDWTVISNQMEIKSEAQNTYKKWIFPKSKPMSTYLFSLHAGPYASWQSNAENIPLRLFVRKSLAKFVNPQEWFKTTKQGLKFYQNYFNIKYPFEKYDQIIVPEFNSGAMENIGAVTFSERFVSRGKKTYTERQGNANVILHEMAHMWFGDLVTMKWWNDLWLNETFATYMAAEALVNATEFRDSWMSFYNGDKSWAYFTDELSTSHPITTEVKRADEAFNNFDGITYGKGASVMKQLNFLMGAKNFQKGVENYFNKFAYKNAELKDFISALQQETKINLNSWSDTWLKTRGFDTLQSQFSCTGKNVNLTLQMKSVTPHSPKTHAFKVALLKSQKGRLKEYAFQDFKMEGSQALNLHYTFLNTPCPEAIYTNFDDYGYFKSEIDPVSLGVFKKDLSTVKNSFLRLMVWSSLWDMVRDQKLSPTEYAKITFDHIQKEKNLIILARAARTVSGGKFFNQNSLYYFLPPTQHDSLVEKTESLYLKLLKSSPPGSDTQQIWMDQFINAVESKKNLESLVSWINGNFKLKNLPEDRDRRWRAIQKLCRFNDPQAYKLIEIEKTKDPSERGKISTIACEASTPELAMKTKWWDAIVKHPSRYTLKEISTAMDSFLFPEQKPMLLPLYMEPYFKYLLDSIKDRDEHFQSWFTYKLAPLNCSKTLRDKFKYFLESHPHLPSPVIKEMKEAIDEDERCEKIKRL